LLIGAYVKYEITLFNFPEAKRGKCWNCGQKGAPFLPVPSQQDKTKRVSGAKIPTTTTTTTWNKHYL